MEVCEILGIVSSSNKSIIYVAVGEEANSTTQHTRVWYNTFNEYKTPVTILSLLGILRITFVMSTSVTLRRAFLRKSIPTLGIQVFSLC